jgi:hypothetical protein
MYSLISLYLRKNVAERTQYEAERLKRPTRCFLDARARNGLGR